MGSVAGTPFSEDYLVLLQCSTTADEHQVCVSREAAEIIEIAWSIVKVTGLECLLTKSALVRPSSSPVTDLCTNSTGLTWSDVSDADGLQKAISMLQDSIETNILADKATFSFIVLDPWDLQVQLVRESREKGISLPDSVLFPRFYSIQDEFRTWQMTHPEPQMAQYTTTMSICDAMSLKIPKPSHSGQDAEGLTGMSFMIHRASDRCSMLLSILRKLAQDSQHIEGLFHYPADAGADLEAFLKEDSKILHLAGLANDTTQSELESWFTQHGGRPIAFWTLRTPDQHKPTGTGFAVFSSHEEAKGSLAMNGRLLAERTIRVSPSSPRILDRAAEILTPFPPSKNRPRPGDWTCPSCGFSNFQRRTACFRCSYPSNNVMDSGPYYPMHGTMGAMPGYPPASSIHPPAMGRMAGMGNGPGNGGHVPFRAGDWSCQACAYHNFARNSVCLKCSMPRAQQDMNGMGEYQGYDAGYRVSSLTDDMARQML